MTRILNRVGVLVSTTGTGTITSTVALNNKLNTLVEAGAVDGEQYFFLLEEGNDYELFKGTFISASNEVSRDEVIESKISGTHGTTKMTLAGGAALRSAMPKEAVSAGWTLIETIAATSGNNKVFDNIPDAYTDLMVIGTGLRPSKSGSTQVYLDMSTNNGSSYDAEDGNIAYGVLSSGFDACFSATILGCQTAVPTYLTPTSGGAAFVMVSTDYLTSRINALRVILDQTGGASNFTTGGTPSATLKLYGR